MKKEKLLYFQMAVASLTIFPIWFLALQSLIVHAMGIAKMYLLFRALLPG